jgi:hypothetical protein
MFDESDAPADETGNEEESGGDLDAVGSTEDSESAGSDVEGRVRTLQSKADKAIAEKNKLQKELQRLQKTQNPAADAPRADMPEEVRQWVQASQDGYRRQLYEGDGRFKSFGFSVERIQGATPAEMRASASELSKFIDTVESAVRKQVQEEHGIAPSIVDTAPPKGKSIESMSTEEFNAHIDQLMKR